VAPQRKRTQKVEEVKNSGPYIPYGLFQTKGEMCAKFGSDRFRNVNLYKFHTYKETNIHLYIQGAAEITPTFVGVTAWAVEGVQ